MRSIATGILGVAVLAGLSGRAMADVKLPVLIRDHMVIQRGAKFTAFGWAKAGEKVTVAMGENKAEAVTGADGMWSCQLAPMEANDKPVEMTVVGANKLTVKDILVGDVWFCAGQSNMAFALKNCDNGPEEVAKAAHPMIRLLLTGADNKVTGPQDDVRSMGWTVCDPKSAESFSGVAYYFGVKLQEELKVPIGLIEAGYGGTANEQWTPAEVFRTDPALADYPAKFAKLEEGYPKAKEDYDKKKAEFDAIVAKINATRPALKPGQGQGMPPLPAAPKKPSDYVGKLYDSSVAPLRRVAMSGIIWYQGENNVGDEGYSRQFPALVRHWRENLGQGDLPFLYVEIVDDAAQSTVDTGRPYPLSILQDAQRSVLALPKTALVTTSDVRDPGQGHPRHKQPVGERLAQAALAVKYGRDIPNYAGPTFDSLKVEGAKAIVTFKLAEGGLVVKGEKAEGFWLAGADGKYFHADAKVDGEKVVVTCGKVPNPVSVRYGWGIAPAMNLYNKADLPAGVFQAKAME